MSTGLKGIELVISDDHSGLKNCFTSRSTFRAIATMPFSSCLECPDLYAERANPRQNSPSRRDIFQTLDRPETERRVKEAVQKYEKRTPKFCKWLEENALEG